LFAYFLDHRSNDEIEMDDHNQNNELSAATREAYHDALLPALRRAAAMERKLRLRFARKKEAAESAPSTHCRVLPGNIRWISRR
jgi:hypothetical protein